MLQSEFIDSCILAVEALKEEMNLDDLSREENKSSTKVQGGFMPRDQ
jgi:hypothetical protein